MKDDKFDKSLKKLMQEDKNIPEKINQLFSNFESEVEIKENKEKNKEFNIYMKLTSVVAVLVIIFAIGLNLKTANISENNAVLTSITAIEPTKTESGIIANDSKFTVKVEGENLNTEAVQKSLYVAPALDYTIEKTLNKNEYKLTFKQNIPDNTIVKLQYVKDQITQDSWAYQTSNKFSITSTYPANNESDVSKKSAIEITFSYADVEDLEKNVKIVPEVKGNWKHLGKIWRFEPENELKDKTKYTVTINKNITAQNQHLDSNYSFSFQVNKYSDSIFKYKGISIDGIVSAKENEQVKIAYDVIKNNIEFGNVEISRFSSIDDFINYLETNDSTSASKVNDYEVTDSKNDFNGVLSFKKSLPTGYYVGKINDKNGNYLFEVPIQISNLSAYAMSSERDILVWVAQNNELAQNIEVEYKDKKEKTNSDGMATFKDIADNSKSIKYLTINKELVIGVFSYDLSTSYPSAYLYTDRTLYKQTDTINVWGFVPMSLFYNAPEDDFYIELNGEGKQKVNIGKNGNFTYKFNLENHISQKNISIVLYYKDKQIGSREISIENYELQNYDYEVITNKNYCHAGEKFAFDVKVTHITGISVPNKAVRVYFDGKDYIKTTGEDGIAHFEINVDEDFENDYSDSNILSIEIYNGDASEYTGVQTSFNLNIIPRKDYTKFEDTDENTYKATLYKLDLNKNANINDISELYNGTYETKVDVNLIESETTRTISGYDYDEYTKEKIPEYDYNTKENAIKIKTVTSTNGIVEANSSEFKLKDNTENKTYDYELEFSYKDEDGKEIKDGTYVYTDYYDYKKEGYHSEYIAEDLYNFPINIEKYSTFRYFLENDKANNYDEIIANVGDTINFTLKQSLKGKNKEIQNNGKVLLIVSKNGILDTTLSNENKISYTLKDIDFPGCDITSAYFVDGKFYRMPTTYIDFDEKAKTVDVEITTDKEEYKPGDKVTVKVKTSKDGKPVKSNVNVSVANEAVFAIQDDTTNLLDTIYQNIQYPVYTYSSYEDDLEIETGGKGDGGGEVRSKFADTAYFDTMETNNNGEATCTFTLPDNVTTYRITAHAGNKDLELGVNTKKISSKLNFFIQSSAPQGLKTSDDVVLNATSIADDKYDVNYTFTINETGKTLETTETTNSIAFANFGKLDYGTYHAKITGRYGENIDSIEYEFNVVESTQQVSTKTTENVTSNTVIKPSQNPIVLEIYNKNMSKYLSYIDFIESTTTDRLDTQIAYNKVQELKNKFYNETNNYANDINIYSYTGDNGYIRNLKNAKENIVLTALVRYYNSQYYHNSEQLTLGKNENIFEYYLLESAKENPVLTDLKYLKDEKNIDNYGKLLVTLSFEFLGDYQDAKDLYNTISLNDEESKEYKSICAIIDTFIAKDKAQEKIDDLIKNSPSDEYLRFAIISFFENNSEEIGNEQNVTMKSDKLNENVTVNGMEVKTYTINNKDLKDISFETNSHDLMVSYYYQTDLANIDNNNMKKDINISIDKNVKYGNVVNLNVEFSGRYEGEVRIALPNSLRLAQDHNELIDDFYYDKGYYIQSNYLEYITVYKEKKCTSMKIPLIATNEGNYKIESIVCNSDGIYHISNLLDVTIKK